MLSECLVCTRNTNMKQRCTSEPVWYLKKRSAQINIFICLNFQLSQWSVTNMHICILSIYFHMCICSRLLICIYIYTHKYILVVDHCESWKFRHFLDVDIHTFIHINAYICMYIYIQNMSKFTTFIFSVCVFCTQIVFICISC